MYGNAANRPTKKEDFDFHIYPHVYDGQVADEEPKTILGWLPVTLRDYDSEGHEYSHIVYDVYVCHDKDSGERVDFFFLNA